MNSDRVREQETIDGAISKVISREKKTCLIDFFLGEWTLKHTTDEVLDILEKVSVPAGKIYDVKDIVEDEHINARGMIETIHVGNKEGGWDLKVPGMSPKLDTTPGSTEWAGKA